MTRKYYEMTREADIATAKEQLAKARFARFHDSKIEYLRVARIFIDSVRMCNKKLRD